MGRHKIIEDDKLLAKARAAFIKEGIGVGSRRLAQVIGVSNSVLFQRFGSMEELFFAAMSPPAPDLAALLTQDVRGVGAYEQLEQTALGLLEYFRKLVPILTALSTHPSFSYSEFTKRHPDSPLEQLVNELMATFGARSRKGEIDCPDVGSVVLELVAAAYGLAMFERVGVHGGKFSDDTVRGLARALWRGIAPTKERDPPGRGR